MAQNATLGDAPTPPIRVPDESIDLSAGIVKKPAMTATNDSIDLSAGLVPRKGKAGQPPTKESEGAWNKLWKGTVSPETATKAVQLGITLPKPEEYAKQAETYRKQGRSGAAALSDLEGYTASFYKVTGDVVSSLTSPGNLALTAATSGGNILEDVGAEAVARGETVSLGNKILTMAAKMSGKAAGLWFGAQGLKIAATPQQPGENQYDAFWRRNLGLSAFLGTAYDTMASAKGTFQGFIRKQFKLNEDLAGKVSSQVQQIDQIRKQSAGKTATIDAETAQHIKALQDGLQEQLKDIRASTAVRVSSIREQTEQAIEQGKGKITDLQAQKLRQGANTVADTMQAFLQEKARVSKPFDDIAAKIKGSVSNQTEVRGLVEKAFKDNGVDVAQIPPRAMELLTSKQGERLSAGNVTMRTPDGHYLEVGEQYVPGFIEKGYESVGPVEPGGGITFDRLTRVREDLGQAANAAKDTSVKRALFKASDEVTDFQERIAEKNKLGPEYRKAKDNYRQFSRGIGSDMVHTFLDASDAEAQALAPKIAEMLRNGENADGLRTVLKAAGVDVKPLDDIISQIKAVRSSIAETKRLAGTIASETSKSETAATRGVTQDFTKDIEATQRAREQRTKEIGKEAEEQIGKVKADEVLPGEDVEALSSKPNRELLEARIRHQMDNAHGGGFVNNWAMTSIMYWCFWMTRGSMYGPILVGKGYLLMNLPRMMRERGVQDWIIRESGMDPAAPQAARMRKGIAALGPVLARSLKTGVPQSAAVKAAQGLGETPQPPSR